MDNWESLKKRRKENRLILLYKGLKGKARIPTDDLIPKTSRGRNKHSSAYQILSVSTKYKIQETLFRVQFQIYNNITLAMSYFVDKYEILRLYKYTTYNKYHSLRGKYHIMHATYRVDENKDLMQNQSGSNGSGADKTTQCQHHCRTVTLVKSILDNRHRPVFSERRQVPRFKIYLHSYRKKKYIGPPYSSPNPCHESQKKTLILLE